MGPAVQRGDYDESNLVQRGEYDGSNLNICEMVRLVPSRPTVPWSFEVEGLGFIILLGLEGDQLIRCVCDRQWIINRQCGIAVAGHQQLLSTMKMQELKILDGYEVPLSISEVEEWCIVQ